MPKLGEPILQIEANNLIQQNVQIKIESLDFVKDSVISHASELLALEDDAKPVFKEFFTKTLNHFKAPHNAFVFSKDDFMRFFDNDPHNTEQPSPKAEYLMIFISSQTETRSGFKKGEPTIVIAGCNDTSAMQDRSQFTTTALDKPATEHPPRYYQLDLPFAPGGPITVTL